MFRIRFRVLVQGAGGIGNFCDLVTIADCVATLAIFLGVTGFDGERLGLRGESSWRKLVNKSQLCINAKRQPQLALAA